MGEDQDYLIETTYEEWRKRMEKIIQRQRKELIYYINQYLQAKIELDIQDTELLGKLETILRNHYARSIRETLDNLLYNIDLLNTVSMNKDEYRFFLSPDGTPYVKYVGVKTKDRKYWYMI